jgi:hypothetical protein
MTSNLECGNAIGLNGITAKQFSKQECFVKCKVIDSITFLMHHLVLDSFACAFIVPLNKVKTCKIQKSVSIRLQNCPLYFNDL